MTDTKVNKPEVKAELSAGVVKPQPKEVVEKATEQLKEVLEKELAPTNTAEPVSECAEKLKTEEQIAAEKAEVKEAILKAEAPFTAIEKIPSNWIISAAPELGEDGITATCGTRVFNGTTVEFNKRLRG